jgi:hypothetical protein
MVDNLDGFLKAIHENAQIEKSALGTDPKTHEAIATTVKCFTNFIDELFCPECGDIFRCQLENISINSFLCHTTYKLSGKKEEKITSLPVIYKATCFQCDSETLLVLYQGPESLELAVLHDTYGGCVTKNTPGEVKYYIDQAYRSRSVGALSAAMAMYRSALEWVLYEQGYKVRMLGQQITALEKTVADGTAPQWAREIAPNFLEAIKDIGNGAMHTNEGDITKQSELDKELIETIDIVFSELLDKIYEQPTRSAANLAKLQAVASKLKIKS